MISSAASLRLAWVGSVSLAVLATPAAAQTRGDGDDYHTTDAIVVTAPYVRSLDVLGNISVVEGAELIRDARGQIGDTLVRQAGVSATSFSPGASRPVLRGFQGERVRVLTDGIGAIDVSNTSADHAVTIDPLTTERVEILRGPAVLLFGSQAIGGAVNVFDRRIPRTRPDEAAHVDMLAGYGTAARDRSAGASIDVPAGSRLVVHVDGSWRRTGDVRVGGAVLAPALRDQVLAAAAEEADEGHADEAAELTALATARGSVANTASETWTAGAGASIVTDTGTLGISISRYASDYGIPMRPGAGHARAAGEDESAEAPVSIGLRQWRADLRGEIDLGDGLFEKLRLRGGFADYSHTEFEGDAVGTLFTNQGIEFRAELTQGNRGGWRGASGVQFMDRDFNAIGAEAFVPANQTQQLAAFTLQEYSWGRLSLEAAARYEHTRVRAPATGIARTFGTLSGALGASWALDAEETTKVGLSVSRAARAPSAEELFSDGAHVATQSYERGDPTFGKERNWGLEASVKTKRDAFSLGLTGYANWFDGFIYADDAGVARDGFPLFIYRQRDARYWGLEAEASARIAHLGDFALIADGVADYTRATLTDGAGGSIPRIPPLRVRGGLEAQGKKIDARVEVEHSWAQRKIAAFETPTAAFTLVNASLAFRPLDDREGLSLGVSANNLFDVDARRHASFTKDFVPLAGRDIRVTLSASF